MPEHMSLHVSVPPRTLLADGTIAPFAPLHASVTYAAHHGGQGKTVGACFVCHADLVPVCVCVCVCVCVYKTVGACVVCHADLVPLCDRERVRERQSLQDGERLLGLSRHADFVLVCIGVGFILAGLLREIEMERKVKRKRKRKRKSLILSVYSQAWAPGVCVCVCGGHASDFLGTVCTIPD